MFEKKRNFDSEILDFEKLDNLSSFCKLNNSCLMRINLTVIFKVLRVLKKIVSAQYKIRKFFFVWL